MQELKELNNKNGTADLKEQLLSADPPEVKLEKNMSAKEIEELELVKDLLMFEKGIYNHDMPSLVAVLSKIAIATTQLASAMLGHSIMSCAGFVFLNMRGNLLNQTAFGLYASYTLIFILALNISIKEKIGISVSVAIGEKDHRKCRILMMQGTFTSFFFFIVVDIPISFLARPILVALGISPDVAAVASSAVIWTLPVHAVNTVGELLRTYAMAQGQCEAIIGKTALPTALFSFLCAYIFIIQYDMSIYGWILAKLVYELIGLAVGYYCFYYTTHPETQYFEPMDAATPGLKEFIIDSVKFSLGSYTEFIGFEFTTYYVALLHNNNYLAAYSSLVNVTGWVYCLGASFAIVSRTRINMLIGMGKIAAAKNFFIFFLSSIVFMGVLIGMLVFFFARNLIGMIYASSNEEMSSTFKTILGIYCFCIPSEFSATTTFVGIKTIGKIDILVIANFITLIVGNGFGGFILSKLDFGPIILSSWLFILLYFQNGLSAIYIIMHDWSTVKPLAEVPLNDVKEELNQRDKFNTGEIRED